MADRKGRLDQPRGTRRSIGLHYDAEAFGNWTERVARFLGTGRYLVAQTCLIIIWLLYNIIAPADWRFDPYTFTFLTLVLSLQAAYAAPLILLAQNRQDDRDRVNLDEDRTQSRLTKADVEYLTRELAAVRIAVGEVATRDFLRAELGRLDLGRQPGEGGKDKPKKANKGASKSPRERNADAELAMPTVLPSDEPDVQESVPRVAVPRSSVPQGSVPAAAAPQENAPDDVRSV